MPTKLQPWTPPASPPATPKGPFIQPRPPVELRLPDTPAPILADTVTDSHDGGGRAALPAVVPVATAASSSPTLWILSAVVIGAAVWAWTWWKKRHPRGI